MPLPEAMLAYEQSDQRRDHMEILVKSKQYIHLWSATENGIFRYVSHFVHVPMS